MPIKICGQTFPVPPSTYQLQIDLWYLLFHSTVLDIVLVRNVQQLPQLRQLECIDRTWVVTPLTVQISVKRNKLAWNALPKMF